MKKYKQVDLTNMESVIEGVKMNVRNTPFEDQFLNVLHHFLLLPVSNEGYVPSFSFLMNSQPAWEFVQKVLHRAANVNDKNFSDSMKFTLQELQSRLQEKPVPSFSTGFLIRSHFLINR